MNTLMIFTRIFLCSKNTLRVRNNCNYSQARISNFLSTFTNDSQLLSYLKKKQRRISKLFGGYFLPNVFRKTTKTFRILKISLFFPQLIVQLLGQWDLVQTQTIFPFGIRCFQNWENITQNKVIVYFWRRTKF